MNALENEKNAYMNGDTERAALYALITQLEDKIEELEAALEAAKDDSLSRWERMNGSAQEYKQFFYDCFEVLGEQYPWACVSNDYDKAIIFDIISPPV